MLIVSKNCDENFLYIFFLATRPKQRFDRRPKDAFTISDDGKMIIKEEEESDAQASIEKTLDVGAKDMLAGGFSVK